MAAPDAAALLKGMMPEVSEADRTTALEQAATELSETALGTARYPLARAYLAAHGLTLLDRARSGLVGAGAVASQSGSEGPDGSISSGSVSFLLPQLRKDTWGQTQWGIELSSLIRQTVGITARVAGIY